LIKEHETFFDDDPYLGVYRGQVAYEGQKYAEADAAWTAAFKVIRDEWLVEQFQRRWVRARYGAGKIVEALDIPPMQKSFTTLADFCVERRQQKDLEKLIDAYMQREKSSVLSAMGYLVRIHADADAATLMKTIEGKTPKGLGRTTGYDAVFLHLARGGRALEAYKAAPDPKEVFQRLSSTLLITGRIRDLRTLIDVHRKAVPTDSEIDLVEGELFLAMHQYEKAIECLKKTGTGFTAFRARHKYIDACYFAGKGLKAFDDLRSDSIVILSLARHYFSDRDAAGLDALLKVGEARLPKQSRWKHEAHLKMLTGKPDEALALFLANRKPAEKKKNLFGTKKELDSAASSRRFDEADFLRDMATIGAGLAVYRAAEFPEYAFVRLAEYYRHQHDRVGLEKLLAEHSAKFPKDREMPTYAGILEILRGNTRAAEDIFRAELVKPDPPAEKTGFGFGVTSPRKRHLADGLARALIRQKQTVEHYRVSGSDAEAFRSLALLCVNENAGAELEDLLAVHRKNHPKDPEIVLFEGEAQFLRGAYEAAWTSYNRYDGKQKAPREKMMACLVRLKRLGEAVKLAKDWEENLLDGNPIPIILAHAAAGDVKETARLMGTHARRYYHLEQAYRSAELGPLLRSDAFRQVRERFPEPTNP
jgi:hypothetical protein